MASLRLFLCFFLFCGSSLNLVRSHGLPKNHVALFILGDSVFDPGNNNYLNTIARANYWPYGETFFKYPTGRFSDGRLIPDFIAEYANLPLIPPYLQPGNQFTNGVNFASAGAGALAETYQGYVIDLKTQLRYLKEVEKQLRQEIGDEEAKALLSKAVYLVYFGANDYYVFPFTTNSSGLEYFSKEEYVGMVIGNITAAIQEIYRLGGRKFGFLNYGSLGCVPGLKVLVGNTGSCFEEITELARLHNAAFSKALQQLETELAEFKYAMHDLNTSFSQRYNDPEKYGFKESETACCGSGPYRGNSTCGGMRGVTEYELCSDPTQYLFFDSDHLSDKANGQVAELFWSGAPNITGPYNLRALFEE